MSKSTHTAKFKFEVVKETLEKNDVGSVARSKGLNANLVSTWRKQFFDHGSEIFDNNSDKQQHELKKKVANMERLLGKKEVEISLLKNFLDSYDSPTGK